MQINTLYEIHRQKKIPPAHDYIPIETAALCAQEGAINRIDVDKELTKKKQRTADTTAMLSKKKRYTAGARKAAGGGNQRGDSAVIQNPA